jgi:hypothetical protein
MPEKYGTNETATLIVLAVEGEVRNPDLRNNHGIELSPAGRATLNEAGLIETHKDNRTYVHKITEAGIAWCGARLLDIQPTPRTGPLVRAVFEVLRRVAQHLKEQDIRIVDVLRGTGGLEALIRAAYQELSTKPQDWVRLAKLRPKLNGAGKDEVDNTLRAMTRTGLVHLAPDSNRKALTEADHAAAIRIGSEHKHLVAIEES